VPDTPGRGLLALVLLAAGAAGCGGGAPSSATPPAQPPRTYVMGFSSFPPRPDVPTALRSIDTWATRSDAGLILQDPPWAQLLAGTDPEALVRADPLNLANYYRGKGLRVVATLDITNGVDRTGESPNLLATGHSLTEPAVRAAYARYAAAFAAVIRPESLGVASETNLVRAVAPPALYEAVVDAANRAAAAVRGAQPAVHVFITVQVEVAWGRLGANAPFAGIARDRADFPFTEAIGLSSYPYLAGFVEPEDVPLDYYARLADPAAPLPMLVVEGGWTSAPLGGLASSPDKQRRYIERQAQILDTARAAGVFQINFTDLDLASFPMFPAGSSVSLFAFLGLVDVNLTPKPALASWDAIHQRPLRP